jgi:glutamyl-tRNA synthetase/glutamyl-Q tRNA(Asp) synthetase
LKLDPGLEVFDDGLLGRQEQDTSAQCGDLLLRDRLGNWTYQCVAAIDDTVQAVTLVVRGQDLLASTGRQIRLARLVGRQEPATFVHHSLVMKSPTQKLSKSDGDTGIASLRATGWSPEQIIARAVNLAGLATVESVTATELAGLFSDDAREDSQLLSPPITDRTTGD